MDRYLNIICPDVPWPADCSRTIDVINRIKTFKKMGIGIRLHYFSSQESCIPNELNQFCESIHVYKKESAKKGTPFHVSHNVSPGIINELIANLKNNNDPLLLEGIQCTGLLQHLDIRNRKIVVRVYNVETVHNKQRSKEGLKFIKKLFLFKERLLIKNHHYTLPDDCVYACVSESDIPVLKKEYHLNKIVTIPVFPSWQSVSGQLGAGSICLYHGNLSVSENEKAAIWLLRNVFTKVRVPFVIAGKEPTKCIEKMAHLCQHTCLVANPTEAEMNDLVRKAHINVLPCFNKRNTGMRLKLLHALYEGRHCVVNQSMVEGTGLEGACHIAGNADGFASIISQLYHQPFSEEEITLRKRLLSQSYNNEENCRKFIQYLW